MNEIPVIDEQEFDLEREQERVNECIRKLRDDLRQMRGDTAHLSDAIYLLESYYDQLEGER